MLEGTGFAELTQSIPSAEHMIRISLRLFVALLVGGLVGIQRELTHKPAKAGKRCFCHGC